MAQQEEVNHEHSAFLKELLSIFARSAVAYHRYLDGGKTFQFAKQLKFHNSEALQLLAGNKNLLPENLQKDAQALIIHYSEWSQKWEMLAAEKNYQPEDVFVFTNDVTFPRQAAQNFEAAFEKLQ